MTTVVDSEPAKAAPGVDRGLLGAGFRGPTFGIVTVVTLLAFENMAVGTVMPLVAGFGAARLGTGLAVAGTLFAATAALGVITALRLEART